jgi:diguanylate cyclase (GGDEF)-like protein/PAS domain S-box-containing protein
MNCDSAPSVVPAAAEAQAGTAVAVLQGLLEISRLTQQQVPLEGVLAATAEIIGRDLGYAVVSISAYRAELDSYEVIAVHGDEDAHETLKGRIRPASVLRPLLHPRYARCGAYFIPEGEVDYETDSAIDWYRSDIPEARQGDHDAWRTDDALIATLDGTGGRHLGLVSVDNPSSGRRPDDRQLEEFAAVAAHAALALDSSLRMAQVETALARNRAVLDSTLDGVIAIDGNGRVLEFNPAAQQIFGYPETEAIGRELAELVLPASERTEVARRFSAGLVPGGELVGRRTEITAMRADGTRMPIEFTVARVQEGEDGAVFYGFVRDISERRRAEAELAFLAYHDPLTRLPNRAQVERELELALARARRSRRQVALMFIDLDDFKAVNDALGHAVGDLFLTAVAERLRSVLREGDVLARQGGDEFIVLLTDLGEDATEVAGAVASKLLEAMRQPFALAGRQLRSGASVGVSVYPLDAGDGATLLRHADAAMYLAKGRGGGQMMRHDRDTPTADPDALAARRSGRVRRADEIRRICC